MLPKGKVAIFFCVLPLIVALTAPAPGMSRKPAEPAYVPGRIIVKFQDGTSSARITEIIDSEDARLKGSLKRTRLHLVLLPDGVEVHEAIERFMKYPEVISAEPDYKADQLEDE